VNITKGDERGGIIMAMRWVLNQLGRQDTIDSYNQSNFFSTSLFHDVQMSGLFDDSKTFVDTTPKISLNKIHELYNRQSNQPKFNLNRFIQKYFNLPKHPESSNSKSEKSDESMLQHCMKVLEENFRHPTKQSSEGSLIHLEHPYIVPGGRFREMYYWDTYFTAEGLAPLDYTDQVENLVKNFASLIDRFGYIPNGNRTYYLGRSQPPFFAFLLNLLHRYQGIDTAIQYLSHLEAEYEFWMDGAELVHSEVSDPAYRRVVRVAPGVILNRYYSDVAAPRPESYEEDVSAFAKFKDQHIAQGLDLEPGIEAKFYLEIRAAVESGWDFSSRWKVTKDNITRYRATELIPVDLNALLYYIEVQLGCYYAWLNNSEKSDYYSNAAQIRKEALDTYCWNEKDRIYEDYCWKDSLIQGKIIHSTKHSLATVMPLFVKMCDQDKADKISKTLEEKFFVHNDEYGGGLCTTLEDSGEQWDQSNAWSPLQSMAFYGLKHYEMEHTHAFAERIKSAWLKLTGSHFDREGKMVEKYNVTHSTAGGGGEYNVQEGFGWTNAGVICFSKEIIFDPYPFKPTHQA
jgi:alpha,alpha-trehalase